MTVNEGAIADQMIRANDPNGDAVTFSKVAGPTFMTVTTDYANTGNIHLAPGFTDAGTAVATVRASDGTLTDDKSFTITVNDVVPGTNHAPAITAPATASGAEGTPIATMTATADGCGRDG